MVKRSRSSSPLFEDRTQPDSDPGENGEIDLPLSLNEMDNLLAEIEEGPIIEEPDWMQKNWRVWSKKSHWISWMIRN